MKQLTLKAIRNKLKRHYNELLGITPVLCGPFEQRIKCRHLAYWKHADAETIRNTSMSALDPIENWMDVPHWQRKLSNKHNAREFAVMHACMVSELYWKGRDLELLDFTVLPENFVIRPTIGHSSGLVFLMRKGVNLMDKKSYTTEAIKEILKKALEKNRYLEFLVEEFLTDEKGQYRIPDDYKFYTFNGEIAIIQVINRLGPREGFDSCYDAAWNQMPDISAHYPPAARQLPPQCLPEMIAQVKKLSKAYGVFVRVDFYATPRGAVFGEFTPTPGLGKSFTPMAEQLFIDNWGKHCAGTI
ncbi:hypothetical protein MKJ04_06460 [Pontibacter sp. E15-1]|uniref:ATP-grasp fold amidoligase family protein n=1 Tax=Pontibacter sp. E15-1 TaxID=2919918 RepID=UPI001F5002D8|nr:ATP-grasp fold amidoligase family protein [Pontibacter sp. E15-1]MCJ8164482.1 hypothetical protein [Pontibacter sp. E15-1]